MVKKTLVRDYIQYTIVYHSIYQLCQIYCKISYITAFYTECAIQSGISIQCVTSVFFVHWWQLQCCLMDSLNSILISILSIIVSTISILPPMDKLNASHTLVTYTRLYSTLCIECYSIVYFAVYLAQPVYTVVYYNASHTLDIYRML